MHIILCFDTIEINLVDSYFFIEWDEDRERFENQLQQIISSKERTIEVYALIMVAVKYVYSHNKDIFEQLGHSWDEMEREFLPGIFRDFVRQCHPEISRPDLILKNYLRDVAKILGGLSISEVTILNSQLGSWSKACVKPLAI